jgi:putative CocE/NonD family hydrolase
MSDGVVLRANVSLPASGEKLPTILTVTGYNKDVEDPTGTNCAAGQGLSGSDPNMVGDGYAVMTLDDRGTGASGGVWDSWGPRTQQDYQEVLSWIQQQSWSNGKVGMYGGSYMGITSMLVAEADARRVAAHQKRAVYAVWADVPMADAYRDVTFQGGATDTGFIPLWLGLTTGLSDIPPSDTLQNPTDALPIYAQHLANSWSFAGQELVSAATGGQAAYDGPFYYERSPVTRINTLRIPVAWTGGWWDIFQRGEPLLYEKMTHSPDKVWFQTPNYHGAPNATAWGQLGIGTEEQVAIKWFDHWLKGADNGIQKLHHVNLYTMGANRWEYPKRWPLANTKYTRYYLNPTKSGSSQSLNDGTLSSARPASPGGDTAPLLPASSPCSRMTAQWTAGAASNSVCDTDNRTLEATALTYTTPPLKQDTEVTGLITANIWGELTGASDATLVAVLSDVSPSGSSDQLTAGFLLASQRKVQRSQSTLGPHGIIIRPYHPFTQASQQAVPAGVPEEYQIEIYPTSNVFKAGDRIRLTISTADSPATTTPVSDQLNELGGTIDVLHGPAYPSEVTLPVIP